MGTSGKYKSHVHNRLHRLHAGGDSGIGREAARALASAHGHVILANKNREKATAAVERIRTESPDAKVEAMHLDLASFRCAHAGTQAPCLSALLAHLRYSALSLFWRGGHRTEWLYSLG